MATVEVKPSAAPRTSWYGYASGLVLASAEPFPGIQPAPDGPAGRVVSWREEPAEVIDRAWRLQDGEIPLERRHSDGRLFLRVDCHEQHGFRVSAPYYGRHLIAPDGSAIASALPRVPPARWQRLFFAQVLPLASALQGLAVFHASAVMVRDRVLAFVGPSGSGKTSLATHLVALGASFVTDDVLALEPDGGDILAHPGPARLSIEDAELRRVPSTQQARIGPCVGRSDKLMLEPTPIPAPLPLGGLYFLRPDSGYDRMTIVEPESPSSQPLLGASFLSYLSSPAFLERHLDACAAVAESVPIYEVELPRACRARDVAARVLAHCEDPSRSASR
jgi:hypothetical protein